MTNPLAIFEAVVELEGADREQQLAALCEGNPEVRAVVERMLEADGAEDPVVDPDLREVLVADLLESEIVAGRRAPEPALPDHVGDYRILRVLGSGGMGVVYEAEEEHPHRRVALKVLHADLIDLDTTRDRFRREVQTVSDLRHPSIPRVFAAGEVDGSPWLAMERIEGAHLHHAAAGRPLEQRITLLIRVCAAVEAAHERGVLHCDLKPSNVMVDQDGLPHILDFGLASTTRPDGDRAGTPEFMPPEQRRGEALGPTADVFALGRIGTEVLPEAEGDLGAVLARATAADPSERYPTVAALRRELECVRGHRAPEAASASALHRLRLFALRHRDTLGALGLALTLLVALLAGADALSDLREQRRQQAREAAADARLQRLQARLGDPGQDRLFEDFARLPENQQTRALAEAWIVRGSVLLEADRVEEGLVALAEGFVRATDEDQQKRALERLGRYFERHDRWDQLAGLLASGHHSPDLERRLRLGTRDLSVLPEPLADWARGTRLDVRAYRVDVEPWPGAGLLAFDQDRAVVEQYRFEPGLALEASWPIPDEVAYGFAFPRAIPGHPGLVVARDADWRLSVWPLGEGLRSAGFEAPIVPLSHASDGGPVFVGTGGSAGRHLLELDVGDGSVRRLTAGPERWASDVTGLAVGDLDGDGTAELVVAQGPWHAFSLTVLTRDGDGWSVDTSLPVGGVRQVRILRTPEGPRIVTAVSPDTENRLVLGDAEPAGPPQGLYVYAWRPGTLAEVARIPSEAAQSLALRELHVGDVDGDGDQDVVVGGDLMETHFAWVLRWEGDRLEPLPRMVGLHPLGLAQADGDPALELVVRVPDDDHHTWVLGSGERPLHALDTSPIRDPSAERWIPDDPALARTWRRAHHLADLGLPGAAAQLLLRAEPMATSAEQAVGLRLRAAELFAAGRRLDEGRELLVGLDPADPELAQRRHRLAVRTALLDRNWEEAARLEADPAALRAHAEELGWSGLPSAPPQRGLLEPHLWHLPDDRTLQITGGRGMLDVFAHQGVVAAARFTPEPDTVGLQVDLSVIDAEFGGVANVLLLDPGGTPVFGVNVEHSGGGVDTRLNATCVTPHGTAGRSWPSRRGHASTRGIGAQGGRLVVTVEWAADSGRLLCRVDDGSGEVYREELHFDPPARDGQWWAVVAGGHPYLQSMARLRLVLHDLRLRARSVERAASLPPSHQPPSRYAAVHRQMRRDPEPWLARGLLPGPVLDDYALAWRDAVSSHGLGDLEQGVLHPALDALDPAADGAAELLLGRAVALFHRGEPEAAAAELDRLLEHPERLRYGYDPISRALALRVALARLTGDREAEQRTTAAFEPDLPDEEQRLERLERWIRIVSEE